MAIDHKGEIHLGMSPDDDNLPPRDGHYSLHADEADYAHLTYGREAVPTRLHPETVKLELSEEYEL